jgi:hypothetical protein
MEHKHVKHVTLNTPKSSQSIYQRKITPIRNSNKLSRRSVSVSETNHRSKFVAFKKKPLNMTIFQHLGNG